MSVGSVDAIERSVHKTNEWIKAMATGLGTDDRDEAWRLLKAYLEVLRGQLSIDEAAQLAAQLPLVLRGAYWEGFDPGDRSTKARDREDFVTALGIVAQLDDPADADRAADAAGRVLNEHITEGELDDVLSQLPRGVREVVAVH
jgi:uncharacterized protein (DUF2267 family)